MHELTDQKAQMASISTEQTDFEEFAFSSYSQNTVSDCESMPILMGSSEDGGTDGHCENPTLAVVADPLGVEVTTSSVFDRVAFLTQNQSDRVDTSPS